MATWILYRAADSDVSGEPREMSNSRTTFLGGLTSILTESWDYGSNPLPKAGDRFSITKKSGHTTNGWPDTYSAPSDWVVTDVRVYETEPGADYDRIVVCTCLYAPIPEDQRQWRYCPVGQVSAVNFGDDESATQSFESFKAENPEKWKGSRRPDVLMEGAIAP